MSFRLLCILILTLQVAHGSSVRDVVLNLAYGIMIYQKFTVDDTIRASRLLLDNIYHPEHVYVFHLDVKSNVTVKNWLEDYCISKNNCFIIAPRNVAWAGLSTAEMMLALMQRALECGIPWEYFILIGHESVPLGSVEYTENVIAQYPRGTNFINCWQASNTYFFHRFLAIKIFIFL